MSRAYQNAVDGRYQQGGRRNLIINGAQTVSQRNGTTDTTVASTGNVYTIDRWGAYVSQASKISVQQSTDAPANFKNSAKVTVQSAVSIVAGDYFGYNTQLEGQDVAHLNFGTSDAQTITISFWVKSSLTGTFGLAVREQGPGPSRSYPTNYTISAANTWEYKTLTISGDTGGTWSTDNTAGFNLWFDLGTGSDYQGTANQWNAANDATTSGTVSVVGTASATWQVTGVQLEVGTVATPFEHRSYGEEFLNCCRYYQECRGLSTTAGYQNGTTQVIYDIPLFVPLRAQPTVSYVNRSTRAAQTAVSTSDGMGTTFSGGTISSYDYSDYVQDGATLQLRMNFTSSVGGSDNTPIFIWPYHTMQINSEL